MKPIKLSESHYVIVDDSEIKDGDKFIANNEIYTSVYSNTLPEHCILASGFGYLDKTICKKITHSTLSLENGINKIKRLSIEEAVFFNSAYKLLNDLNKEDQIYINENIQSLSKTNGEFDDTVVNEYYGIAMQLSDDEDSMCCCLQTGTGNTKETSNLVERWFPYSAMKNIITNEIDDDFYVSPNQFFKVKIFETYNSIKYEFYNVEESAELLALFEKPDYFEGFENSPFCNPERN